MKYVKEYLPYVLILLIVILIKIYIVTLVRVDGTSMVPTLENKQVLVLKKYDKSYNRFDIIVLNNNEDKLVKRIIGLPGEHIEYKDNKLYINNKEIKDIITSGTDDFTLEEIGYKKIPDNYYFVLGDNRNNSLDSRYIGLVNKKDTKGTVTFSVFPFDKFGKIK